MTELKTPDEFINVLDLKSAIIYFLVTWSGPERASRAIIHKVFNELEEQPTPAFQIDCSKQNKQYVIDWLSDQSKDHDFNYGGYGETVLISNGRIIDFIKYPAHLGYDRVKEKIIGWMSGE